MRLRPRAVAPGRLSRRARERR